jgi:phage protein D
MGSAKVKLLYEGVAITQGDDVAKPGAYYVDTAGDLLGFEYTDNADGKVDDLQISLMDRKGLWRGDWLPRKGAKLWASILPAFGDGELVCGDMWIDEVEAGGPPSVTTIKAVSVPLGEENSIRGTKRTRAWEATTLEGIAKNTADVSGLKLFYQGDPVEVERADQHEESDLAFLARLAEDFGYVVKVGHGKLVVYDQELLEDADPVAVVDVGKGDGMVTRWDIRSKTRGTFRAARVMYRNPIRKLLAEAMKEHPIKVLKAPEYVAPKKRGRHRRLTSAQKKAREQVREDRAQKTFAKKSDAYLDSLVRQSREEERREEKEIEVDDVEFLYTPDGAPVVGSVLEITKRVKDEAEAKRVAERMLRNANRDEVVLSLDLIGDVAMRAGLNIVLVGAGQLSGKYHIDHARHGVRGGGYATSVGAHRVLAYR